MKTRIILILLAAGIGACGEEAEPKSLVHDLTILGVRAEPPEAAPGQSVALDALVGDPKGAGRAVTLSWFLCEIDPAIGTPSCEDESRLTPMGNGPSLDLTIPANVLESIPAEMRTRGIDLFVAARAAAGEETSNVTVKRVRVSENPSPNTNPVLTRFDVDGIAAIDGEGSLLVPAGKEIEIFAGVTDESHDAYVDDLGAPAIEEMKFAWFLTAGIYDRETTWEDENGLAQTTWTAPKGDETEATLWVVMRDGRGGIDWRTLSVESDE